MQVLSFTVLSAGLLRMLLIADQPVQGNSFTTDLCPCEIRGKTLLDDRVDVVDVAIVLAADMSGSINQIEATLQRESYAAALESSTVLKVIKEGMHGKIAVTFVEWSSRGSLKTRLDWTVLSDANDASAIAEAIRKSRKANTVIRTERKRRSHTPLTYLLMRSTNFLSRRCAGSSISQATEQTMTDLHLRKAARERFRKP
ncbi:MAG: DUF1194 domain-containing protein [Mesorhizobium sp.]|nr:MAG: DUF1194 domain-containing protein [Mesorhizobium sp.]RWQ54710.1 MAG: DUF1194 domain-containing protein [Mesorhizobium sp.]